MSLADDLTAITDRQSSILVLDIERLPGTAYVWDPRTKYVPPGQFTSWPRMICFSARWYGQSKPLFHAEWDGREQMVRASWELVNQADIVVGYFSSRADMPWLKTEWIEHGLKPPAPWKDVDLYRTVARFGFESRSLDVVTKRLGHVGKTDRYSIDRAVSAVNGDVAAQRRLKSYCARDTLLTLWLYNRLRGWISDHPHVGDWGDDKRCNQCGSGELRRLSKNYRAQLITYSLYRCESCGGHVRGSWETRSASTRGVR